MEKEIMCGATSVLDLAQQVREHLAAKGYAKKGLIRYQKIWNHFARYANNCFFTLEVGISFLQDTYGIEWSEFPPPMKRHQRRSLSAIRYLRDYELTGEITIHRPMKQPYVWPDQFSNGVKQFLEYTSNARYSKDYMRGTIWDIHRFIELLSENGVQSCEAIDISQVMTYIREHCDHLTVSTLKTRIGRIRSFLKFLYLNTR